MVTVFVELNNFNKKWEDIDNDKERFYFCIRHMHELKDLPDGRAEGRAQGLEQGLEQGKLETARKLKDAGIAVDIICQCTSLTKEQVAAL